MLYLAWCLFVILPGLVAIAHWPQFAPVITVSILMAEATLWLAPNAGCYAPCVLDRIFAMRFPSFIGFIHPRLAVVVHDLLMVWLAWYAAN